MDYDENVPALLKREQQWFGLIIGRPIDEDSRMNPISPSGRLMEEEAAEHILPSPTLRPAQRIQIYNQQYWWRLLNTLHESFPFVTRLLGYFDFNRLIGIPYLAKYPPRHWSLALLGDRLPDWCFNEYKADNSLLIARAVEVDWAFSASFIAGSCQALSQKDFVVDDENEEVFKQVLYLQPSIYLFQWEYDLMKHRFDFLAHDPNHWQSHEIPILDHSREYFYILYRNVQQDLSWKEISKIEYLILNLFRRGSSLDEVCSFIENLDPSFVDEVAGKLQGWFHEWALRGWLSLHQFQLERV